MARPKKNNLMQFIFTARDKTDFASIESGLTASAITAAGSKKFFGVDHGGSAAFTSGTLSKALADVRSGVYRVTVKGSECNYDWVRFQFTHASMADVHIDFEMVDNDDSDLMSALTVVQSMASDAASAAAQANSRVLLTQSLASDAHSAAAQANSRALLAQSSISDVQSYLVAMSGAISDIESQIDAGVPMTASDMSDLRSAVAAVTATLGASDISDIASAVQAILASDLSDIRSAATQINSRAIVNQSTVSDIYSLLGAGVPLDASTMSDIRSAVAGVTASIGASDISDIASAVVVALASNISDILSAAQQANSRVLVNQSHASNIYSLLSDLDSNFQSRVPKAVATNSQLSDVSSDLRSYLVGMSGAISDIESQIDAGVEAGASTMSDVRSAISALPTASQAGAAVWEQQTSGKSTTGTFGESMQPIYKARILYCVDEANTTDEWTVAWYKNGVLVTSGITSPTLTVRNRAGTAVISAVSMTQIGTTGIYKYDATGGERVTSGDPMIATAAATIDSGSRTDAELVSRDSAAP